MMVPCRGMARNDVLTDGIREMVDVGIWICRYDRRMDMGANNGKQFSQARQPSQYICFPFLHLKNIANKSNTERRKITSSLTLKESTADIHDPLKL